MEVFNVTDEVSAAQRAVAVGMFDGVHLGHQAVIHRAVQWAALHGIRSTVLTFDPHPQRVLRPDSAPNLLTPPDIKLKLIEGLGVDDYAVIAFDAEFSQREPEQFCEEVIAKTLGARFVSVGKNFCFGHKARGDVGLLTSMGAELGYETATADLIEVDGKPVSSTVVRGLVRSGEVDTAASLLGHKFIYRGTVIKGDGRGHQLGFPTANIELQDGYIVPAIGIYAAIADGNPAAVSIGVRPTFGGGEPLIEAYLLDRDVDLYGQELELVFVQRLRDELKFDSTESLVEQMRRDVEQVAQMALSGQLC